MLKTSAVRPWLLAMILLLLPAGCGAPKISDRDLVFVNSGEANRLATRERPILGGTQGVWVDPRTDIEFRSGHIAGALNIPLEQAETHLRELESYETVIVYGETYNDPVALAMSKTLLGMGLKDVRTLRGGLRAWQEAGNELETGRPG
ncbi:MAG: rhodanese-like domain-containing protein [Planctomycetota bacterium]|jgi:3-mercaptopyruvate sulfurtransferase SseA